MHAAGGEGDDGSCGGHRRRRRRRKPRRTRAKVAAAEDEGHKRGRGPATAGEGVGWAQETATAVVAGDGGRCRRGRGGRTGALEDSGARARGGCGRGQRGPADAGKTTGWTLATTAAAKDEDNGRGVADASDDGGRMRARMAATAQRMCARTTTAAEDEDGGCRVADADEDSDRGAADAGDDGGMDAGDEGCRGRTRTG
uniref:Uncharacterized protein n=1 Tax=Oryza rufipogon TaxID=4529 RepID=A0A0E0MUR6_ORYRU